MLIRPATPQFFSYCFSALLPVKDIDLFLVELDINNDP